MKRRAYDIGPVFSAQYTNVHIDGFTEQGAFLTVTIHADSEDLPNGAVVRARYIGSLKRGQQAPWDIQVGDEYTYLGGHWIWMVPAGKNAPEWVDP